MEWQQRAQDDQAQHHLVCDLGMHDPARLAQRVLVDVLHTPGHRRRRAVVLTVDHITDAADGQPDHRRRPTRVDDLPERVVGAPRPHVHADDRAEQATPLADAALGQREDAQPLAVGEDPPVFPDIKGTGSDEAKRDHPRQPVSRVFQVGNVFAQEPEAKPCGGDDPQHREDAVPGDEERAERKDVGVEVDDDRERRGHLRRDSGRAVEARERDLLR